MDIIDLGWVAVVLSGVIWNIYLRLKKQREEQGQQVRHPHLQPQTLETVQEQPADPAPRMSSGARGPAAPSAPVKPQKPARGSETRPAGGTAPLMSRQNLKRAIILREVLGEPRSKQPWRPGRKGR